MKASMLLAVFVFLAVAIAAAATSSVIHSFQASEGQSPLGPATLYQGNFYGTTVGGTNGFGNAYRLYPKKDGTYAFVDLHDFNGGTEGFVPAGQVAVDASGNLFGVCERGGIVDGGVGGGTVWELIRPAVLSDPWQFVLLSTFDGVNGSTPRSGLVYHNGAAWGVSDDSIFRVTPDQNGHYQFELIGYINAAPGSVPFFGASSTTVYGISGAIGASIYSFTLDQFGIWNRAAVTTVGNGMSTDPYYPAGGALIDSTGAFYGLTSEGGAYQSGSAGNGGGTIYKIFKDVNGVWTTKILRSFNPNIESYQPAFSLLRVKNKYYGVLAANPTALLNEVFQSYPSATSKSWVVNDLQDFTSGTAYGSSINALTTDTAGNIYGTSAAGGDLTQCGGSGCGLLWKITP